MAEKIIGIDLGTTNSVVAVMEGGDPVVIPNAEGGRVTPSVVAFTKDGERLVGQVAKRQAVTNPQNTVFSIKRFMGRRISEVVEETKRVPYKVVEGPNGLASVEIQGNGDTHLGGDDFDARIMEWLVAEFKRDQGIDLSKDPMALQRLKEAAEKAKMELSTVMQTEINLPFITADQSGPKHLNLTLTRAKLEQLVDDLVKRTMPPMEQALKDAGLKPTEIDEVILVGGQTRMPKVQEIVKTFFGKEPHKGVNPDEVVAIGAAIQGGVLAGEVTLDVDATGIRHVPAKDRATGKEKKTRIEAWWGLGNKDIEKMVKDAEAHAAEDKRRGKEIERRNRLDTLVYEVEKSSKEWVDKLDASLKTRLDKAVEGAKQALRSGAADEISKALEELQPAYSAAGASMYAAQRGAGAPGSGGGAEQPAGGEAAGAEKKDNVVDADYEIVDDDKKK